MENLKKLKGEPTVNKILNNLTQKLTIGIGLSVLWR